MDIDNAIKEQFDTLPPKLQTMFVSEPWIDQVIAISKKYNLTEDQAKSLEQETIFSLLGIEPLSSFRTNLVNEVGITYDQALKIAFDANQLIFASVANELKEVERETLLAAQNPDNEEEIPTEPSPKTAPAPTNIPTRMIPDHQAMEITDGPHLHSQNIMPQDEQSGGRFGTIIDQKLSRIVKNRVEPAEVTQKRTEKYKGNDPYREPIE